MSDCKDCKDNNVVTPNYSEATPPTIPKGCVTCSSGALGNIIIPPSGGGNTTLVEAGNQIAVDDNSYVGVDSFKVHSAPYTTLTLSLSLIAYVGAAAQGALVLFGKIIDSVELNWSYNKAVLSQVFTNDAGLNNPTLLVTDRTYTYTPTVISVKKTFELTGNDGEGQAGSIQVKNASVDFANYIMWGDYDDIINENESIIDTLVTDLLGQSIVISNTKGRSVFATGSTNRHFFYLLPTRLGEVIFSKNNFVGGFYRLKVVTGVIKSILDGGDVETDIIITNSEGYSESYYLYQSSSDDQADAVVPFIIT